MHSASLSILPKGTLLARVLLVVVILFAGVGWPGKAFAEPYVATGSGKGVYALVSPSFPDGPLGWNRGPVVIRLVALRPGVIYYTWDDVFGVWHRADGPIIAPEGKRVLYSRLVSDSGKVSDMQSTSVRVDYQAPRLRAQAEDQASASAGVVVRVRVNPVAGARKIRLGGSDRYETAALISKHNFESADTVIIATGTDFADALAASGLAGCVEGPVLLTRPNNLPGVASSELLRLRVRNAIIVGGEGAVHHRVRQQLEGLGLNVERIGGVDRYETATRIAARAMQFGQHGGRVFVARGDIFADAVALGPLAYAGKAPVILVRPTEVPLIVGSFLRHGTFSSGLVAGGQAAVSPAVFRELGVRIPGLARAGGDNRYSTAVAVAGWGVTNGLSSYSVVGVATGQDFADALTGGMAIGASRGVIFLTTPQTLPPASGNAIAAVTRDISTLQVFGGLAAVSPEVFSVVSGMTR
ncbi:MAG: cell wall-binding repeat-containing protein [Actinobacteria bacterium]|nr:cell wall-binding repeat-containing protein [Actinomycetota bacterium]